MILIDNAMKYSNKNGTISVVFSQAETGKPVLAVRNTGVGIPEDERMRVFDRFYRSDFSRTRESGGYGLGLAIAKAIADRHKCAVSIDGCFGEWVSFTVGFS